MLWGQNTRNSLDHHGRFAREILLQGKLQTNQFCTLGDIKNHRNAEKQVFFFLFFFKFRKEFRVDIPSWVGRFLT